MKLSILFWIEAISMKRRLVGLICCSIGGGTVFAQSDRVDGGATSPQAVGPALVLRAPAQSSQPAVAKVKEVKSKLDRFQRLLSMNTEEREKSLATKSDKERSFLRRELKKYDEMPPEERETALQGLRMWYYIRELVKHPVEARKDASNVIPEEERKLVEVRLLRWDRLPADLQQDILENERTIRWVLPMDGLSEQDQKEAVRKLPPSFRNNWDEKLQDWHAIPTERRQEIYRHFQRFSALSSKEREKVLETLSQNERLQAEKSLLVVQELEKLSPEERAACLESFQNFIETPPKSDQLYLKLNVIQRWNDLSVKERDVLKRVRGVLAPGLQPPIPGSVSEPPRGERKSIAPSLPGVDSQKATTTAKNVNYVSFREVPEAVQEAIMAQGGSADTNAIKRTSKNGEPAYKVNFNRDGKPLTLYFAADGSPVR